MLCIHSFQLDPFFNLAAEEYLLRNSGEEVFMLWQSDPVVVVGKHQNTLAEINYRYVKSNNIQVARRLTGGGTVYHDHGNVNFTFIRQGEPGKLVNFGSFIAPVISFLKTIGIEANQGQKNEMLVDGKKISGNAEHIYKNRVLHHGTLLFSADLNDAASINPDAGKYTDRAVQSNRSAVMNLAERINRRVTVQEFCERFMQYILLNFRGSPYHPDLTEQRAIHGLADDKYRTWEWVYGWSPDYTFQRDYCSGIIQIRIDLAVHRGIIMQCSLKSAALPDHLLDMMSAQLTGTFHEENYIMKKLTALGLKDIIHEKELEALVLSFF
jgi:lipoate-protein ligase A